MKKVTLSVFLFSSLFAASCLMSCGGGSHEEQKTEEVKEVAEEPVEEKVEEVAEEANESSLDLSAGEAVYKTTCLACHQATGLGLPNFYPPLAKSDYLMADKVRAIKQVKNGSEGEIVVNGETFTGVMPPQALDNQQIADVLTYVMNSWGNDGGPVTKEEVDAALAE